MKTPLVVALWLALLTKALVVFPQGHARLDSLQEAWKRASKPIDKMKVALLLTEQLTDSDPVRALEFAEESGRLALDLKSDSLLTRSYLNEASIYLHIGNYPRALQLYQKAIAIGTKINEPFMLTAGYGNIGTIYYHQGDHSQALKYYTLALEHFEKVEGKLDRTKSGKKATLLSNIGIIHEEAKNFKEANHYYSDAYQLAHSYQDEKMMANILNNQGTLYADMGNQDSAFIYYHRAMALRARTGNQMGMARSFHNLGLFFMERRVNVDSAFYYLKKAIQLGEEIGLWETVQSSTASLYRLYRDQHLFKDALETLELNRQVNDSLFNEQSTRKIAQLEMQFEFDRKQDQLRAEQREKELYIWMAAGGLFLLLVIVTLLFFLQRARARKSELEQAQLKLEKLTLENNLATRDKELATNIMYLLNKNELINSISEKLLDIKNRLTPEAQPAIHKVILDMQSNLQPELWKEFEFRFQQVHEQFYNTLNERFPDLTPSERRLCAFLKLNMTTKEISAITHQNAKSIDVARTRLRKKLNLTGTDHNLVSFLLQLGS